MARRREARRVAVGILYQADVSRRSPLEVLAERQTVGERVPRYAQELVRGVEKHRRELDGLIGEYAEGWTVPRMAAVDRTLLRVAGFELLHRDDIPAAVAIDEAVAAAKVLSTKDSGRFINGVLGRIAREHAGAG
ncbi:MAG: transcription antitermination factor NusB [Actinomycetota bacterium]